MGEMKRGKVLVKIWLTGGQLAAPKSKYIEHILVATHSGEAGIAEVFRALNYRLKDSHWTVCAHSLLVAYGQGIGF